MERIKNFLFKNSGIRQTVVKNTFWVALGTTITKIIRVVIIIYIARTLGTEDYGIFTYAMSLVAIFSIFSDIGLTSILTRELIKRTEEKKEYLSTALVVKLGFLIGTIILIAIFTPLITKFEAAKPLLIIMAITIAFESLQGFFYAITRSQNKMEVEAGISIITEILTTIVVLGIFFKYPSVKALAIAYMIGNTLGLIITLTFLRENLVGIFKYFKKQLVGPIIMASWPFAVMGFFGIFMTNIDSVIIGIYTSPHILGLYASAQKPISLLHILPNFLAAGLFPIINKFSRDREEKKLSAVVEKSALASLLIALPIVVGGIIIAEPLISVTFGNQFIGAVFTLQILLVSLLIVFPGSMLADLILAENKQKVFIKSSFLGAATNVILDIILIPIYGITGSAVATVIAILIAYSFFFSEARKITKYNILGGIKKMVIATIIMAITTYILKTLAIPLLLIIGISAILYFALLLIMKEEIVEDVRLSFRTKNKITS